MATTGIYVAHLTTTEKLFDYFEVECWNSAHTVQYYGSTSSPAATMGPSLTSKGYWDTSALLWRQTTPLFFANLTIGTTYAFRARVVPQAGETPSAWSAWVPEVAGDMAAPNPTYAATFTPYHRGVSIKANQTNLPSPNDIDYYDLYASTSFITPAPGDEPSDWSSDGEFDFNLSAGTAVSAIYFYLRAVDTSGNRQAWTYIGTSTPLTVFDSSGLVDLSTGVKDGSDHKRITAAGRDQLFRTTPSHGQNLLYNPNWEQGLTFWESGTSGVAIDTNTAKSGNNSLSIVSDGTEKFRYHSDDAGNVKYFEVNPGDILQFGVWVRRSDGETNVYCGLRTLDKDKNLAAATYTMSPYAQLHYSYELLSVQYTVPAGIKYVGFFVAVNSAVGSANFDEAYLRFVRPASQVLYGDGQAVDDLQPAEPGAEITTGRAATASGNLVGNGGFEAGDNRNWDRYTKEHNQEFNNPTAVLSGVDASEGGYVAYWQGDNNIALTSRLIPVNTAKRYLLEFRVKRNTSFPQPSIYAGFACFDKDKNFIPNIYGGTYNYVLRGNALVPDNYTTYWAVTTPGEDPPLGVAPGYADQFKMRQGTKYISPLMLLNYAGNSGGVTYVDYFRILEISGPVENHPRVQYLTNAGMVSASTIMNSQGSLLTAQPISITATWTTSSVTLTWGAQSLLRNDGSYFTLNAGNTTYGGLSAGGTYYIYARVSVATGNMGFTNGSPPPTTPSIPYAMQCSLDGYMPVGVIKITIATSGTGGGDVGNDRTCPEEHEFVETQERGVVEVGTVQRGEHIRGKSFHDNADVFREVIYTSLSPCSAWYLINGRRVSPCEPVWWNDAWSPAYLVTGAEFDTTVGKKVSMTVQSDEYDESNFYLVPGTNAGSELLIHNERAPAYS